MTAREEILTRIRASTHAPGAPSQMVPSSEVGLHNASAIAKYSHIPRDYKHASTIPHEAILHQLEDRLRDYDAHVYRATLATLPTLIASTLHDRGKTRIAIPTGLPPHWLAPHISFIEDDRAGNEGSIAQIDSCEGVLTTAILAIAETGTIVLQDAPGQGRRVLTLLPDYHLCILLADQVVQTVPEAIAFLQPTAHLATTFFSGPSATADIEMTRIKGVHGPRFFDVILVA